MVEPTPPGGGPALQVLYDARFSDADRAWKAAVWRVLWRRIFSRWIAPQDVLVDIGAGFCEFLNAAVARRRIAVDLNPAASAHAAPGVELHSAAADDLRFLADGEANVVFASNFLEHLPDKAAVFRVAREVHRVLAPGGRWIVMGPNIRFAAGEYWDFYDHHVPLSDRSICELLATAGFCLEYLEARFLPLTATGRLSRHVWLVDAYLALRPLSSHLLGKQFLAVARKD